MSIRWCIPSRWSRAWNQISLEYQIYSPAIDTLVIGMVLHSRRGSANDYGVPWFGGDSGDKEYHPCMPIWQTEKASWFVCFITFANGHVCVIVCKFAEKYIRSNPHRSSGRLSKFVGPSEKWGRPKRNVRMQAGGRRQFSSSWKSGGGWNFEEWGFCCLIVG